MSDKLVKLPLSPRFDELGAKLVPFAGFSMPIQFEGIIAEHKAVRERAGLFDVSHMGEVFVRGREAVRFVNTLVTHDLAKTDVGQARYTVMCHDHGGIVDDLLAYKLAEDELLLCVNAANRDKDYRHIAHLAEGFDVAVANESDAWGQLALQGPRAVAILTSCAEDFTPEDIAPFRFRFGHVAGVRCLVSRTGYTGEDGFEIYMPIEGIVAVFDAIVANGAREEMVLCGLGCRDTLRLEAKLPLYGQDLTDDTNPLEAGLSWVVKLDKAERFLGQDAIERIKAEGVHRRLRAFRLQSRGVPRPHCAVYAGDQMVGKLTSGSHGPTVGGGVGMGYVDVAHAGASQLNIDIRGRHIPADVSPKPFYQRNKS